MENQSTEKNDQNRSNPRRNKAPDPIVFEEEDIQEGLEECGNSVVGKLTTEKSIHVNSLSNAFNSIWNEPKGFKVIDLVGEKIFQFFFQDSRVVKGQPWSFRNSWLILKRWERHLNPNDMDFRNIQVWVQLWGLPIHCRTRQMGRRIGACMGTVSDADIYEIQGMGSYVRILVEIDVSKPLLPGINAGSKSDGVFWVDFQFEKLPQFCYQCGMKRRAVLQGIGKMKTGNQLGPWLRASLFGRRINSTIPKQRGGKPHPTPDQEDQRKKYPRS
ncbi:Zinc knuckle CX2CX4HX4C [Sesbania bispinosa]|nr:Zinc knuckle CX2CX4HX4C [Sesbania bispinosa]